MNDTIKSALVFLIILTIGGILGFLLNTKTVTKTETKIDTVLIRDTVKLTKVIPVIDSVFTERIDTVFSDSSHLTVTRYLDSLPYYDVEYVRRDTLFLKTIKEYVPEYVQAPFYRNSWFYAFLGAMAGIIALIFN